MSGLKPATSERRATTYASSLRGASVDVDVRCVASVIAVVSFAVVAVVIAVLAAAGASKNSQLDELHDHGTLVAATVLSCHGLLGGSGSNGAGYSCVGAYRVRGQRYVESLPGSELLASGTTVRVVVASTDPGLLTSPALLRSNHASWRVFVVPGVLSVALLPLLAVAAWRARRGSAAARSPQARDPVAAPGV